MNESSKADDPRSAKASPVAALASSARAHEAEPELWRDRGRDWAKVRELALAQLDKFVSLEPKVLRGDNADAVHDLRVASRRLQQVLDLLYPPPRPAEMRKLRRRIRRARRALSGLRNGDVLVYYVAKTLARKRTARREAWEHVQQYLVDRRLQTLSKALRKLSKVNLSAVYVRLKKRLTADGAETGAMRRTALRATAGEAAGPAAPVVDFPNELESESSRERLARSLEQTWQAFKARVAESDRDSNPSAIHRVRVAAKRLRYLTEVIHQFEVARSAEVLAWLRRLQQHLGDWHDLEVLEQMMIEMVGRPEFLRQHLDVAMEVEKLVLRNRAAKRRWESRYAGMMKDPHGFQTLATWVTDVLANARLRAPAADLKSLCDDKA